MSHTLDIPPPKYEIPTTDAKASEEFTLWYIEMKWILKWKQITVKPRFSSTIHAQNLNVRLQNTEKRDTKPLDLRAIVCFLLHLVKFIESWAIYIQKKIPEEYTLWMASNVLKGNVLILNQNMFPVNTVRSCC